MCEGKGSSSAQSLTGGTRDPREGLTHGDSRVSWGEGGLGSAGGGMRLWRGEGRREQLELGVGLVWDRAAGGMDFSWELLARSGCSPVPMTTSSPCPSSALPSPTQLG